jgi:DHA2 family multidrug resistance protein
VSIVAAVSLVLFFWIELTSRNPLLNLRLLLRRNFGLGSLANVILGMALYGSVYLLPVYLSQMQGYNSEQVGMVLAWTGLPQLVLIPCVPFLMRHVDTRFLVAVGFGLFAFSCFMNLEITPDYAGDQLFVPNLVRAVGQALVLTPLSALATGGIERENAGSASAMFNMMRNLGGSVGIAVLETFVTKREQFHSSIITARASLLDPATRERIVSLQERFLAAGASDPATAWHDAVVQIGRIVRAQSYLLAYSDAFYLMGAALVLALLTSLAMRKSSGGGAGAH